LAATKLEVRGVTKEFPVRNNGTLRALGPIDLAVEAGGFICLLGPSGCGKSTLLNIIAGLDRPTAGEVRVDGVPVRGTNRNRVMIFQNAGLFPWLNVQDNVEFGLRMAGLPKAQCLETAKRFLGMVHLDDFAQAYIHELSGGMRQRVALARALAIDPDILLMDEPFGALDAQARDLLHHELQTIWTTTQKTIVFVTHNVREAIVLGDQVLVFSARPGTLKKAFRVEMPRPRQIDSYGVVDLSREIMAELRDDVLAAELSREQVVQSQRIRALEEQEAKDAGI
jgi:NitT/TauT family transport system ATP-binding protein